MIDFEDSMNSNQFVRRLIENEIGLEIVDYATDDNSLKLYVIKFDGYYYLVADENGYSVDDIELIELEKFEIEDAINHFIIDRLDYDLDSVERLIYFDREGAAIKELDIADENYAGECCIFVELFLFANSLTYKKSDYLRTEIDRDIVIFDSYQAAKEHVDELDSETYVLTNNESERPTYHICKA